MEFHGSMIIVRDIKKSKQFYEENLNMHVEVDLETYIIWKEGFSMMEESSWLSSLEIESKVEYKNHAFELYFEEENFSGFYEKIRSLNEVNFVHHPKTFPWHQQSVRFYDPDNHVIEVGESMISVVRRLSDLGHPEKQIVEMVLFPLEFVQSALKDYKHS